ncbi:hypothetical protein DFJ63DRAFT_249827 [Scheffersomyces coipomensis]|uniref:uncharacterized protein n=1 Tax=Scheffersomyces coipomensis TaxID=1788519 RepID=UPI00315D47BE
MIFSNKAYVIVVFLLSQCLATFVNTADFYDSNNPKISIELKEKVENKSVFLVNRDQEIINLAFDDQKELKESEFWKKIVKKKDVDVASNTYIHLIKEDVIYLFADSERLPDKTKRAWDWGWGKPKHRTVEMVALKSGEVQEAVVTNIPVSPCISNELSSSESTFEQSYKWNAKISLSLQAKVEVDFMAYIAAATAEVSGSLSLASTGSVKCTIAPGGKIQVFGDLSYAFFPEARVNSLQFREGAFKYVKDTWEVVSETGGNLKNYGIVLFNLNTPPTYSCVDNTDVEIKLKCAPKEYFDINSDNPTDPLEQNGPRS